MSVKQETLISVAILTVVTVVVIGVSTQGFGLFKRPAPTTLQEMMSAVWGGNFGLSGARQPGPPAPVNAMPGMVTAAEPLAVVITAGLFFLTFGKAIFGSPRDVSVRVIDGDYLGVLPRPVDPSLFDPLIRLFKRPAGYQLMTIRRIPPIVAGGGMPHPYVGPCTNCHLYVGGPGPGSQYKTPVGAVLEQLSRLHKLGPPIWPDAEIPHPPAGRCIKCHDIVVKGKRFGAGTLTGRPLRRTIVARGRTMGCGGDQAALAAAGPAARGIQFQGNRVSS